jgi:hypothetical protein
MARSKTLLIYALISLLAFSCQSHKANMNEIVNKFADLECRAMTLRENRFALANQLRFTQDTLLNTKTKTDTARLSHNITSFNTNKEILLKQSLSLADSIKTMLNSLMKDQLATERERAKFNQMLNTTLLQRGCLKK